MFPYHTDFIYNDVFGKISIKPSKKGKYTFLTKTEISRAITQLIMLLTDKCFPSIATTCSVRPVDFVCQCVDLPTTDL